MSMPRPLLLSALLLFPSLTHAGTETPPDGSAPFKPVVTKAAAANRIASKPDYVRSLSEAADDYNVTGWEPIDWLEIGLDERLRYELRDQDYRTADLLSDDALFHRALLYIGVREILDPFRFVVEFEDSRRFVSDRPESANEANHTEILQGYGELYFEDALAGEPLSLRFGRMAFDAVDRRLISRNRYRNTINALDGVRARLGTETSWWELDTFAMRPVNRSVDQLDESSSHSTLYGVNAYLRGLSPDVVVEPYWLFLDQDRFSRQPAEKHLHTLGVHAFGLVGDSGWDYDVDVAGQFGETQGRDHQAWSTHAEVGYTFPAPWKPRAALWLNYATGDEDPTDGDFERFDPLYGASFAFYGYSGYFLWQNTINPAVRLSIQPTSRLKAEVIHRAMWLASDRDAWVRGLRVDTSGESGSFVGQELDLRAAYQVSKQFELEAVYASFFPGGFVDETGASPQSSFAHLQATIRF